MSDQSNIEWCDATWQVTAGCEKIAPGCKNCFAIRDAHRMAGHPNPKISEPRKGLTRRVGNMTDWTGIVRTMPQNLDVPLRWKRGRRIFVNSNSDLFHDDVPFEYIAAVFGVMAACPQHTFQVLTKRPERMLEFFELDGIAHTIAKERDKAVVAMEVAALKEERKPVEGFPGYEVTNKGVVYGPRGALTPDVGEQGHSRVTLYRDRVQHKESVHRLVLAAFDRPGQDGEQARHRNGDATCNALPNLLWGSQSDNWADAKRHGSHRRYSKLSSDDVAAIRDRAASGESAYSIAKDFPVSDTQIRNIVSGQQWATDAGLPWPLPWVWLGTSIANQPDADKNIPILLRCPAAVRFVSAEPLLGLVDLYDVGDNPLATINVEPGPDGMGRESPRKPDLDWVIVGGESGPGARPCDVAWIRGIVEQCKAAGVACFVKQAGSKPVGHAQWEHPDNAGHGVDPQLSRLDDPKGGDPSEWPSDLRVRQFPEVARA